jgi:hypothetical protein
VAPRRSCSQRLWLFAAGGIGENDYSECMVPHTNRSLSISLRILLRSSWRMTRRSPNPPTTIPHQRPRSPPLALSDRTTRVGSTARSRPGAPLKIRDPHHAVRALSARNRRSQPPLRRARLRRVLWLSQRCHPGARCRQHPQRRNHPSAVSLTNRPRFQLHPTRMSRPAPQ